MYNSAQNLAIAVRTGWNLTDYSGYCDRTVQNCSEFVRQTALFGYCDRREFLNDVCRFRFMDKRFWLFLLNLEECCRPEGFHQFAVRTQMSRTLDRFLQNQYCLADEQLGQYILLVFSQKGEQIGEALLRQALAACCEENHLSFQIIASPPFLLFEEITQAYGKARRSQEKQPAPAPESFGTEVAATEKILAYLQENYSKRITLTEISGLVHMNASYVSRLLPERTGKTFSQHLLDIRIGEAKRLLTDTSLKSCEIAGRVGFENAKYFSYVFAKAVGIPPMKYRYLARERNVRPEKPPVHRCLGTLCSDAQGYDNHIYEAFGEIRPGV